MTQYFFRKIFFTSKLRFVQKPSLCDDEVNPYTCSHKRKGLGSKNYEYIQNIFVKKIKRDRGLHTSMVNHVVPKNASLVLKV